MHSVNKYFLQTLVKVNRFSYYIHLKDHNKKINPQKNRLSLSFMNPKIVKSDVPKQQSHIFNLRRKTQKQLERKMFEQYKEKVLKGQIDQDEQIEIDPLWGQGEKPKHYYQNLSKTELMTVSSPQSAELSHILSSIYQNYFKSSATQLPTVDQLQNMTPSQLVNAALYARINQVTQIQFWHYLQKSFGNKFYQLSQDQLIQLTFSLRGVQKRGTPRIHNILKDLLEQDLEKLSHEQLASLFFSFQHSKIEGVEFQDKILTHIQRLYSQMSFQQKINWLLTYTIARKPQSFKQGHTKILNQRVMKGHQVIFGLNFSNDLSKQITSIDQCLNLVYSLAKLRAKNTKFITSQILAYLKENVDALANNVQAAYKLLYFLEQLQGGQGVYDEQLFGRLITIVTEQNNFASLTKIQQIRTIYAIWNYHLLTDQLFELYKGIQLEGDSTLLYYFCQIQLSRSSERQWEVLRCMAQLDFIPINYYLAFKRFSNYIKVAVPDWDLTPIEQKLRNTEYFYDSLRAKDVFHNIKVYNNIQKYFKFSQQIAPFEHSIPIDNVEVAQFGSATFQVSVDVVNQSAFVPGTNLIKQSVRNKTRSLQNIGWKHIFLRERQVQKLPANRQIQQILCAFVPYKEEQLAVIANQDYYRAEQIQAMGVQQYWGGMIAQQAEGYRNNPQQYAKKIAEIEAREKKLSEDIAKAQ